MLLQAHEGLSDREACDRLGFDLRWQAAAGVDTGAEAFHPTVLPGQRNRLRASVRPRRLFEDTKAVATTTGAMKGRARVLDSTPSMTQSQPRTPSPSCEPRCESCSEPSTRPQVPSHNRCGQPSHVTTTTPPPASRRATGTTRWHKRPSSTTSCVTAWLPSRHSRQRAVRRLCRGGRDRRHRLGQDVEQGDDASSVSHEESPETA